MTRLVGHGYGLTVALHGTDDAVRAAAGHLPFWWTPADAGAEVDPALAFEVWHPEAAREVLAELQLAVAERAAGLVFLHAGVVSLAGRALLLPGRSHVGKSTLVAALTAAGAVYGSDEYAPLRPDGTVLPYPRPLALRTPAGRVDAPPAGAVQDGPLAVAGVAVLQYDATTAAPAWAGVTPAEAVLHLLDNAVCARSRPTEALAAVAAAAGGAATVVGTRPDAPAAVDAVLALLADPA